MSIKSIVASETDEQAVAVMQMLRARLTDACPGSGNGWFYTSDGYARASGTLAGKPVTLILTYAAVAPTVLASIERLAAGETLYVVTHCVTMGSAPKRRFNVRIGGASVDGFVHALVMRRWVRERAAGEATRVVRQVLDSFFARFGEIAAAQKAKRERPHRARPRIVRKRHLTFVDEVALRPYATSQ